MPVAPARLLAAAMPARAAGWRVSPFVAPDLGPLRLSLAWTRRVTSAGTVSGLGLGVGLP